MHWKLKGLLQKTLGTLPFGEDLHYLMQRTVGGMRDPRREIALKLEDWDGMVRQLRDAGMPVAGARMLEIGSGWYPLLPLACHLAGAARVHTVDLNRLLKPRLMRLCVDLLGAELPRIAEAAGVPLADVQARYARLRERARASRDPATLTDGGIDYRAPADAAASGLPDGSIDIVFSNSVLEHVPPDAIRRIHAGTRALLRAGGVAFHSVNCGDHYAYADRKVHQLNYLQYSDAQWAFWNNRFLYQNRLRAHQLVDMARDAGFEIALDTSHARPQRLQQLQALPLAEQFRHMAPEKLCITTVDFIARKMPGAPAA